MLERFWRDESGPTAVEYAVLAAGIVVAAVLAVAALGLRASALFQNAADRYPR
jgi:Flp pilus assembly pilin Flp